MRAQPFHSWHSIETGPNEVAREVLDGSPEELDDSSFFSHVHGRNLRRVMRNPTRMKSNVLKRARWLLRFQTADNRWRWFLVKAHNRFQQDGRIRLLLQPLREPGPSA